MPQQDNGTANTGCVQVGVFRVRLRYWRKYRGLSTKEAAKKLGVADSTWSQWESGAHSPTVRYLEMITTALDVPLCCLFSVDVMQCPGCCVTGRLAPALAVSP